jgi:8-oxo-dGTP diphosphatase
MPYKNPKPTVDVILQCGGGIVLIERANPPFGWALPGGFVDEGETVEHAAKREVLEETGLNAHLQSLFYVYSDPARDKRQHTISVVFVGSAVGTPTAGDDAARAEIFDLDALPTPLAFDHDQIIQDFQRFLRTGQRPSPDPCFDERS